MHIVRDVGSSQIDPQEETIIGVLLDFLAIIFLVAVDQAFLGGKVWRAIWTRIRALFVRLRTRSPEIDNMPSSSNKLSSDPTSAVGVHGDIPNSGVLPTSPPRFDPTLYTHNEASRHTLASPHSAQSPTEPLVPNRLEHLPSLSPVSSTSFSTRESMASTIMLTSEEDAYITDGTTSTIPPSYKTHRSHPDLPGYSWTVDQPPLPLPITSTSPAEYVAAPPPAYVQRGRRRRRRHHRVGGSANSLSSYGEGSKAAESVLDPQERPYETTQSREAEQQRNPKKSTDGGVRLAGGPLNEV